MTDAKKRYREKIVKLQIDLFPSDIDVIEWLQNNKPVATYIKKLIRDDIKKELSKKSADQVN